MSLKQSCYNIVQNRRGDYHVKSDMVYRLFEDMVYNSILDIRKMKSEGGRSPTGDFILRAARIGGLHQPDRSSLTETPSCLYLFLQF